LSVHAAGMDGAVVSKRVRGWRKAGGEYDWRRAGGAISPRADVRTRRTIRHSVIVHVKEPLMTYSVTRFGTECNRISLNNCYRRIRVCGGVPGSYEAKHGEIAAYALG